MFQLIWHPLAFFSSKAALKLLARPAKASGRRGRLPRPLPAAAPATPGGTIPVILCKGTYMEECSMDAAVADKLAGEKKALPLTKSETAEDSDPAGFSALKREQTNQWDVIPQVLPLPGTSRIHAALWKVCARVPKLFTTSAKASRLSSKSNLR